MQRWKFIATTIHIVAMTVLLVMTAISAQATTDQVATATTTSSQAVQELSQAQAPGLTTEQCLRREKCHYLWQKLYPWSYHPELVEFFCGEHERAGLAKMWWHSLVYGASGSELRPRMICRGGSMVSRGLMDCAWTFAKDYRGRLEPLLGTGHSWGPEALFDPWVSIRCHVLELSRYRSKHGREDWSLLRQVFLPANPDGGRTLREQRRWLRIEATHRRALAPIVAQQATRQPVFLSARP